MSLTSEKWVQRVRRSPRRCSWRSDRRTGWRRDRRSDRQSPSATARPRPSHRRHERCHARSVPVIICCLPMREVEVPLCSTELRFSAPFSTNDHERETDVTSSGNSSTQKLTQSDMQLRKGRRSGCLPVAVRRSRSTAVGSMGEGAHSPPAPLLPGFRADFGHRPTRSFPAGMQTPTATVRLPGIFGHRTRIP